MSNKNKNQQPSTTPASAPAVAEAPTAPEPAQTEAPAESAPSHEGAESESAVSAVPPGAPPAPSSELAAPAPVTTAIAVPIADVMNPDKPLDVYKPGVFVELISLFPLDARYLKQIQPVPDEELTEALKTLPEAKRAAFQEALDRMNPVKIGSHSRRRDGLTIFDVRINHGTGNDETRPKGTPEGGLYSTDSRILATGDRDLAAALRAPELFDAYVIFDRKGNTYWPPRDEDKKDDGGETRSNAPLCRSVDAEKGDVYGSCDACPYRPFVNGSKPGDDECRGEVVMYVVPADFSGIYRFVFTGTNTKAGRSVVTKFAAWREKWDHPFAFKTKKEVDKNDSKRRWFVVEAEPQRSVAPSPEERAFLLLLARKIDTEVYWTERRRIHLAAAKAKPIQAPQKANLSGLLASAQAGAGALPAQAGAPLKDLSKGNNL